MPNIKSAKKRVDVIARRKEENNLIKASLATAIKKFKLAVDADPVEGAKKLSDICSQIDSAETRGVIHKNAADRKKARMSAYVNRAQAKAAK